MHTEAHCRRLAAWLATQGLRASVAVHLPKASKADLVIWPYRTSTPAGMRNAEPTLGALFVAAQARYQLAIPLMIA